VESEGAVWFRRTVELPATWKGRGLELSLGPIDHFDVVYVNGERIGGITEDVADPRFLPRVYTVPPALVTTRRLVIAVRVFCRGGIGGFTGSADQLHVRMLPAAVGGRKAAAATSPVSLAGPWRYRVELALEPKTKVPPPPLHQAHQHLPAMLNNAMVQPLVPYGLRGAVWYQGENNVERAEQYRSLLPALIRDWRLAWGQGAFPFGIVQLAAHHRPAAEPGPSAWAELREAQTLAAQATGIGLVTTIDVGDEFDIHPRDKRTVGERLAAWARATVHGQEVAWSGPRFAGAEFTAGSARVRFVGQQGALATRDGKPPTAFAIAGRDRSFVWAQARIDGDGVVLTHPDVTTPLAVRYAWSDHPLVNLVDAAGLPALPFRTDDWPLSTAGLR
jgi:sialate O-acetylesterase